VKEIIKLLLAFAPWLAFWFIAGHTMLRLQIGIIVAAILVIIMSVTKINRGAILWAGCVFFAFALISVVLFKNMWVISHLGILASGTLFVAAQLSILIGRPFTEDYARDHVPKQLWDSASFIRACFTTTAVWSCIFLINSLLNVVKLYNHEIPEWHISLSEYATILAGIVFTSVFSWAARKKRAAMLSAG
jgi:hypothetical protein